MPGTISRSLRGTSAWRSGTRTQTERRCHHPGARDAVSVPPDCTVLGHTRRRAGGSATHRHRDRLRSRNHPPPAYQTAHRWSRKLAARHGYRSLPALGWFCNLARFSRASGSQSTFRRKTQSDPKRVSAMAAPTSGFGSVGEWSGTPGKSACATTWCEHLARIRNTTTVPMRVVWSVTRERDRTPAPSCRSGCDAPRRARPPASEREPTRTLQPETDLRHPRRQRLESPSR